MLTAIIFRVRAGNATLPLVSAYDVFEQTWSPSMPYLFQRRFGTEDPATDPQLHPGMSCRHVGGRPDHRRGPTAAVAPP